MPLISEISNNEAGNSVRYKLNQVISAINAGGLINTILSGSGVPNNALGKNGDFYINLLSLEFYGPKVDSAWPLPGISLIGPQGDPGINGTNGSTILSGSGVPGVELGLDGDYYFDSLNSNFYGPKTAGVWGTVVSLIGGQGDPGIAGRTILSTTGAPGVEIGEDGDFALDPVASLLYGPKAAGAWGSPISIKGATGSVSSASTLNLSEQASTPTTPAAGTWELYPKADGFYVLNDAGNETQLGGSTPAVTNINTQTGTTYTLALEDTNGVVTMNNVSPNTVIIPTDAAVPFPDGTWIEVWQIGSGDTKIEAPAVALNWAPSGGQCFVGGEWASVLLRKVGTDKWLIKQSGVASVSQPS